MSRSGNHVLFGSLAVQVTVFVALIAAPFIAPVAAHEMTVQGTVTAIETGRIQVKTGKEHPGDTPSWYPIDAKTKIKRGKKTVTLADARIKIDERIVIIIDHPDKGPMKIKEIRLAEQ